MSFSKKRTNSQSTLHFFSSSIFQILCWEKEMRVIGSELVKPILYDPSDPWRVHLSQQSTQLPNTLPLSAGLTWGYGVRHPNSQPGTIATSFSPCGASFCGQRPKHANEYPSSLLSALSCLGGPSFLTYRISSVDSKWHCKYEQMLLWIVERRL